MVLVNTALLLVALNLLADGILDFRSWRDKVERRHSSGPYSFRKYDERLGPVYPELSPEEVDRLIHDTGNLARRYEPYVQFAELPIKSRFINVSGAGFREGVNQSSWPPKKETLNVFVFGGSTTFGYGLQDTETIPSWLQRLLKSKLSVPVQVYNFGRGSYQSSQERILLQQLVMQGTKPDVVIFIDGLNDLVYYDGNPALTHRIVRVMNMADRPPVLHLLEDLPLMRLIRLYKPLRPIDGDQDDCLKKVSSVKEIEEAVDGSIERYLKNMSIVQDLCNAWNVQPLFVWQPIPTYKYDRKANIFGSFAYDEFSKTLFSGYCKMESMMKSGELGSDFVWAANIQEQSHVPLYVDAFHYSGEFCKMIAQFIASEMLRRDLGKKIVGNRIVFRRTRERPISDERITVINAAPKK